MVVTFGRQNATPIAVVTAISSLLEQSEETFVKAPASAAVDAGRTAFGTEERH
jgi:hypothetical protein